MKSATVTEKQELRIMDVVNGDIKIEWDRDNAEEVSIAKKAFKKAKEKGMLFYKTKGFGGKGKQINEFDPDAEKIIGVPALRGG